MKFRTLGICIKSSRRSIRHNKSLAAASIVTLSAALLILGIIVSAILNLDLIVSEIESRMEVTVFLSSGINHAEIESLENVLVDYEGTNYVNFTSRQEALANWKLELGEQSALLEGFTNENNPLPDYFVVTAISPTDVERIARFAQTLDFVERVSFSKPVVDFILDVSEAIRLVGGILVLILLFIGILVMSNAIRVAVLARKKEISIMKFLGATNWFIRLPFVFEGILLGASGGVISVIFTGGLYYIFYLYASSILESGVSLHFVNFLTIKDIAVPLLVILLPLGLAIGVFASIISISKHLKV